VGGEVLVAPLVTGVLGDEVEVFTADDQGACSALVLACCQGFLQHCVRERCALTGGF
jgi:hypothetical protein